MPIVMERDEDIIILPVVLSGELRARFAMVFREVSVHDPDASPSELAARILAQVLDDDLFAEQPTQFN